MSRPIIQGYFPFMSVDPNSSLSIILIDDSFSLNGIDNTIQRKEVIYNNYKENDLKTPLQSLGKLFETGKLTKVSVIELKDINVYINYGCC